MANRELRYPWRVSHNTVDALETERAFCHNLIDEVRQGFVKVTTGFSYNRRCHSFPYSSSRLDPHSDYRCFLIGREKPLCIFSLPSTSLRQSSLTARGRKLYVLRTASVYLKTLFHLYTKPVYVGKISVPSRLHLQYYGWLSGDAVVLCFATLYRIFAEVEGNR